MLTRRPAFLLALLVGCSSSPTSTSNPDAGADGGQAHAPDAGTADAGPADAGLPDGSIADAGPADAGPVPPLDAGCLAPAFAPDASYPSDGGLSPFEAFLANLPHDSWYELPNSSFMGSGVQPPQSSGVWGIDGPAAVIKAWSGGAWDGQHRQMLLWGGGHSDYSGDEVYAFDLPSASWRRLTDPDPGPFDQDPLADGQPVSRHTYDGLQWVQDQQLFFAFGGSRATDGHGTEVTWTFDVDAKAWTNRNATAPTISSPYNVASVYDPVTKLLFARSVQEMYSFDFAANQWTKQDDFGYGSDWTTESNWGEKTGVLDSKRHLFFAIGNQALLVWDLGQTVQPGGSVTPNPTARVTSQWQTTGGDSILAAGAPGADYDPVTDEIVAWSGGSPWTLDLATKSWTEHNACGAPAKPVADGTYGRFRYLPEVDAFMLVNDASDDVYFYRR